jgi:hypothetical protein
MPQNKQNVSITNVINLKVSVFTTNNFALAVCQGFYLTLTVLIRIFYGAILKLSCL